MWDSLSVGWTGETTMSTESTAWVGGIRRTSASVNPSNGDPSESDITRT